MVDSSVWIRADRSGGEAFRDRLRTFTVAGVAWICWPIHAELLIGLKSLRRWQELDLRLSALEHAEISEETWRQASRLG